MVSLSQQEVDMQWDEHYSRLFVQPVAPFSTDLRQFSISDSTDNYKLFLGGPATGTLGDMMLHAGNSARDQSGMSFSTPDKDNYGYSGFNCAAYWKGGWWFNVCHKAYLTGPWNSNDWFNPWSPIVTSEGDIDDD
ncbi:ficolin-1-like [Saccostrea echinata]|uniref:ficolin-1-like n=1 Tax=Saccostrea echinata TaxID=191078 RepID=UPI002A83B713|nr:ficolin-1-like [Saccostrea echinata]